jgi:hypothetical protein
MDRGTEVPFRKRFQPQSRQRALSKQIFYLGWTMRLRVHDLLIAIAAVLLGMFAVQGICYVLGFPLARLSAMEYALGIVAGVALYLVVTPVIYQRLHMRPMWYPLCPTCRDKNRFWAFEAAKSSWPRENVRCFTCGTTLELWYGPRPNDSGSSINAPTFALMWPQSFGRWRRIDVK